MKILVTCHSYYPNKDGVQSVTQYLCEGLVKKGHKVTVVTRLYEGKGMSNEETRNGVHIIRIKSTTRHTIHRGDKKGYVELIKKLALGNDVMINVCTQCATTDWLLKELDYIKIPKILYNHSIWDFKYNRSYFITPITLLSKIWANLRWRLYYRVNAMYFKKYNYVTQLHEMDYATSLFEKRYKIKSVIIENAAEDDFFSDSLNSTIKLPKNYMINVSNYQKRKNQLKCLELYLEADIPDSWELVLIGSHKNKYSDRIEKHYLQYKQNHPDTKKKVSVLYDIPREDIPTYVKKARIYLMTSRWEAFPISLVESMAAGVPFVSSDVGIVKYLQGGVVCNNGREYCYWLHVLSNDNKKRIALGNLGRLEAMRSYRIDGKVDKLESLILECINNEKC